MALGILLGTGCHKSHDDDSPEDSSSDKKKTSGGGGTPAPPPPDPGGGDPPPVPEFTIMLAVVDEDGAALPGAVVSVGGGAPSPVAPDGTISFPGLDEPQVFVVTAPGFLDEPFILDASDAGAVQEVRLWAETGPSGAQRVSLHFCGDAMLGRRFLAPGSDDTWVVTPGDGGISARGAVELLAPICRAATVTSVNVETVIGTLPDDAAYPGKLFVLQSVPEITAMLDEMGVDLAVLGNNHIRDWLEAGIASTGAAIDAAGIAKVGAGETEAEAAASVVLPGGVLSIGFLSYSTINGDSANDSYPLDANPVPPDLDPEDAWQYEFRSWGFTGSVVSIPTAARRIGSAWAEIVSAEALTADESEEADMWASATAVYPELQDWVARRGHGGANRFSSSKVLTDVAALRAAGCEIVVVQIHGGHHTYSAFQSAGMESSARAAIDAGADAVVGHHPHVLQGFEWHLGRPIVYSIGNCVFDQDFLQTFTSGVLRFVYEDATLLEARMLPLTIHRYRPAAVSGSAAADVTQLMRERSVIDAHADRFGGLIQSVLDTLLPGSERPAVIHERHSARFTTGPPSLFTMDVTVDSSSAVSLPGPALTRSRGPGGTPLAGVLLGRDVFRWGHFEDEVSDGESKGGYHWHLPAADAAHKRVEVAAGASGLRALHLTRTSSNTERTRARPVARVNIAEHRLYDDLGGGVTSPADGDATWSVRLRVRLTGDAPTTILLDVYHFDSSLPNEEADSTFLRTVELGYAIAGDGVWREVIVDIPATALEPLGGLSADQVMFYMALYPPTTGTSDLFVDNVQFLEWREAALLPDFFYAMDAVRSSGGALSFTLERRNE
ncbi:MAG: CapA family protein [Planctomycetes bacterium]|nr:CapA family protein [Planctomycetota bacterium]